MSHSLNELSEKMNRRARARLNPTFLFEEEKLIEDGVLAHAETQSTRTFLDLPDEYVTPELSAIQEKFEANYERIINKVRPSDEDYRLIGIFVQLCAHIDLNLHHCRRLFCRAELIDDDLRELSSRDQLLKHVRRGIRKLALDDEQTKMCLSGLTDIKRRLKFRDKVVHFTVHPYDEEDCLVFVSARDRDAKSIFGSPGEAMNWNYSINRRDDFKRLIVETEQLSHWLSEKVRNWHLVLFGYE